MKRVIVIDKQIIDITQKIKNTQNEILFVGTIFSKPDLLIEYGQFIKSKYDFEDEATKFFYDILEIIFKTRTQIFNSTTIATFMTEDKDRLKLYNKYGAYKTIETWSKLSIIDDHKTYVEILKKYSLLREYYRNGFDVSKIINHPKFELFNALDIYRMIRSKADRIHTVILTNSEVEVLNSKMVETVESYLNNPNIGAKMPFPILNDLFRGIQLKTMLCTGMTSNSGKSRFMFKLIAYLSLVLKLKCGVFLNEMSIDKMRLCLLTTVINNEEFQQLHGIILNKKEREIAIGLYNGDNGEFIYRKKNEDGEYTETLDEYKDRVRSLTEYKNIIKISEWIERETEGIIFAEDISDAYDDKTLEFKMRKINLTQDVHYLFYDTLKNDTMSMGDWAALKVTTTKLSELAKDLDSFVYASIQLTDEAIYIKPDELTSMQIANAKQIKHVLDSLLLAKEIDKSDFGKYHYISNMDWGKPTYNNLDNNKRYYVFNVDKNRDGEKKKILFEIDLNYNTWYEIGEIFKK